jgi:hypothetical protein
MTARLFAPWKVMKTTGQKGIACGIEAGPFVISLTSHPRSAGAPNDDWERLYAALAEMPNLYEAARAVCDHVHTDKDSDFSDLIEAMGEVLTRIEKE